MSFRIHDDIYIMKLWYPFLSCSAAILKSMLCIVRLFKYISSVSQEAILLLSKAVAFDCPESKHGMKCHGMNG